MSRAAVGKAVRFHYTGSLGGGSGSDSSIERDPLRAKLGAGEDLTLELKLVEIRLGAVEPRPTTAPARAASRPVVAGEAKVSLKGPAPIVRSCD